MAGSRSLQPKQIPEGLRKKASKPGEVNVIEAGDQKLTAAEARYTMAMTPSMAKNRKVNQR